MSSNENQFVYTRDDFHSKLVKMLELADRVDVLRKENSGLRKEVLDLVASKTEKEIDVESSHSRGEIPSPSKLEPELFDSAKEICTSFDNLKNALTSATSKFGSMGMQWEEARMVMEQHDAGVLPTPERMMFDKR